MAAFKFLKLQVWSGEVEKFTPDSLFSPCCSTKSSWSRARHVHQSCTGFQGVEQDRAGVGRKNSEFCEPHAETGAESREDVNPPGPVHPTGQKASGPVSIVTVVIAFSFLFSPFLLL